MSAPQGPKKYPSVDLAYPLAVQSYDLTVKRFDALDARIQSTLGLGVSLTFAIPVALSAFDLQFRPLWMGAAFVVFLLAIILGICARLVGAIKLVSPTTLYNDWIQCPEEEFKQQFIGYAGKHMEANASLLEKRYRLLCGFISLFFLEALLFGVAVFDPPERSEPDQAGVEVVAESVWSQQVVTESARSQQVLAVVDPALMNFHSVVSRHHFDQQIAGRHHLLILQSRANATPFGLVRQARRMRPARPRYEMGSTGTQPCFLFRTIDLNEREETCSTSKRRWCVRR